MTTREQWLNDVAGLMHPWFNELGYDLPAYRISIGFPSTGAKGKAIGQCWCSKCSKDGTHEIFIHPELDDSLRIADVLAHELCHAAAGIEAKHGPGFRKVAVGIGLEGKMTATVAGPRFLENVAPIIERVGAIPHGALNSRALVGIKKKQTTRMVKAACGECGYTIRTTQKWLDVAIPECPLGHGEMEI